MGDSKTKKEKQKYSIWQNTAYMLKNAWHIEKSVIWLCIAVAVIGTAKTTAELFIAPAILNKVEQAAPLTELVGVIAVFAGTLFALSWLEGYINIYRLLGKIVVRIEIMKDVVRKQNRTSYENLLDTGFRQKYDLAMNALSGGSAGEEIWNTWALILQNVMGLILYFGHAGSAEPVSYSFIDNNGVISYTTGKWTGNESWKGHEEKEEAEKRLDFVLGKTQDRHCAKDIRIFGLRGWLEKIWNDGMEHFYHFQKHRERVMWCGDTVDVILGFLRNGIVYGYLISTCDKRGITAAEFLLYLGAAGGISNLDGR